MSNSEFLEWQEYLSEYPFATDVQELQMAMLISSNATEAKVQDFIISGSKPPQEETETKKRLTVKDIFG